MVVNIEFNDMNELENLILILNLGIVTALESGIISIEDSEKMLYRPKFVKMLERLSINKEILDLIEQGCELEDIESLIPEYLTNKILQMKSDIFTMLSSREKKQDR